MGKVIDPLDLKLRMLASLEKLRDSGQIDSDVFPYINNTIERFCEILDAQPAAVTWIPVTESLPADPWDDDCEDEELTEYNVMIKDAQIPTTLYYAGKGLWYRDCDYYTVVAWQPLPEPYKEEQ